MPVRCYCYDARKVDVGMPKQTFTFDTHKVVQNLEAAGKNNMFVIYCTSYECDGATFSLGPGNLSFILVIMLSLWSYTMCNIFSDEM